MSQITSPPARIHRAPNALRPVTIQTGVIVHPAGSAEISFGATRVLCTASVDTAVPAFAQTAGTGWVTAEYAMLPGATHSRSGRGQNSRAKEISRLVGRVLRQAVDLRALEGHLVTVDCDVLQADGGTRTASVTGGYVALALAIAKLQAQGALPQAVIREPVAAISVGLVGEEPRLDLDYQEDSQADVDLNVAMTASGRLVEIQGTAEGAPFTRPQLDALMDLAEQGINQLFALVRESLQREG